MHGMNAKTGKPLSGFDHVRQSVVDILTTRINSRVLLRDYGFDGSGIIDAPGNADSVVRLFGAVAKALDKWEPRFRLSRILLNDASAGRADISLYGEYRPEGGTAQPANIEGLVIA